MKFSAFVRIRPEPSEERLRSDDPELDLLLEMAATPLPPDEGEGLLTGADVFEIFDLDTEARERVEARRLRVH